MDIRRDKQYVKNRKDTKGLYIRTDSLSRKTDRPQINLSKLFGRQTTGNSC